MNDLIRNFLTDPAVTSAIVAAVGGVFAWAAATLSTVAKAKYNVQIDATMNAALMGAIERAVVAALARGVSRDAIPNVVTTTILSNMPDTASRFGLNTLTGAVRLKEIVADTVGRAGVVVSGPLDPAAVSPTPPQGV